MVLSALKKAFQKIRLFDAVRKGDTAKVLAMFEGGLEPDLVDFHGNTTLFNALERQDKRMATLLIECEEDITKALPHKGSYLHLATEHGLMDIIEKMLLRRPELIRAKDSTGHTALHIAVRYGRTDIARVLLAKGIDPDVKDNKGRTALKMAKGYMNSELVEILSPVTNASHDTTYSTKQFPPEPPSSV